MLPKLIGLCISTIHQEDRFDFIHALNRFAVERGYRLLIFDSSSDLYEAHTLSNLGELAVFQLIPYDKLDAMLIFPHFLFNHPVTDEITEKCKAHGVPVIMIDKIVPGCFNFSFSYADIFEQLCRHVIDEHHAKRLFMVAGTENNVFSDQRIAAFKKAMDDSGLPYDDSVIAHGNFWDGPTVDAMRKWFEEEKRDIPDAIICANDYMAIAVVMYLQKHGVRVPEDCIVTGFDGVIESQHYMPHLTTCKQDYDQMSTRILDAIEAAHAGKTFPANNVIGFRMICSQSCGCVPVSYENLNDVMQENFNRLRFVITRQEMVSMLQSSISKMDDLHELPEILINKFVFHSSVFAINNDIFQAPHFGSHHKGAAAFTDKVDVLYHRYFWFPEASCTIDRGELIPDWERALSRTDPIVICAMHFFDLTLGYCAFQTEITHDEYEKIYTFMNAINASFGAFHGQKQIQAINAQLTKVNEELENLYIHDYLTGLYNRRGFYISFHRQQEQHAGENMCAFIISVDLDRLKYINDSFGHLEGDNAICTVAQALLKNVQPGDICARFGGDEFAVGGLLPVEEAEARFTDFREHFLAYLDKYNAISQNPYRVEASIGFYAEPATADLDLDDLIRVADNLMYADKQARRKARQ